MAKGKGNKPKFRMDATLMRTLGQMGIPASALESPQALAAFAANDRTKAGEILAQVAETWAASADGGTLTAATKVGTESAGQIADDLSKATASEKKYTGRLEQLEKDAAEKLKETELAYERKGIEAVDRAKSAKASAAHSQRAKAAERSAEKVMAERAAIRRNPIKRAGASLGEGIGSLFGAGKAGRATGAKLALPLAGIYLLQTLLGGMDERLGANETIEGMRAAAEGQRTTPEAALEMLRAQRSMSGYVDPNEALMNQAMERLANPPLTPRETYIGPHYGQEMARRGGFSLEDLLSGALA